VVRYAAVPMNKRTRGQGRAADFPRLLAGRPCLEFANTIEGPISADPEDFLRDYASLARWSWHARAIDDGQLARLNEMAEQAPEVAAAAFEEALQVRQAIDGVFRAIAAGERPAGADLDTIERAYVDALGAASLAGEVDRFRWSWRDVDDVRLPLWLAVVSAVELLTGGDLARVKQCRGPADDCGWLFYDTSKSGTRRWCSMEGCGSRSKMRRHYARHRAQARPRPRMGV
jgi:predicted RNA-binding Zn ribbon-like protein